MFQVLLDKEVKDKGGEDNKSKDEEGEDKEGKDKGGEDKEQVGCSRICKRSVCSIVNEGSR
ncbi:2659_t:CDS:2 [Cetraspora pellucida]|uniref:2659_t:CDS:1 n=1 Tax=Cetraspora pellucida TaxID=1433469 RepID=A0A9N8VY57_9GLOM|nr:2659_t:CDS:2 [Cetraspora pellucida]